MCNTKDVLRFIQQQLTVAFDVDTHQSLLCFKNGVLDLKTGLLQGQALPGMRITQSRTSTSSKSTTQTSTPQH